MTRTEAIEQYVASVKRQPRKTLADFQPGEFSRCQEQRINRRRLVLSCLDSDARGFLRLGLQALIRETVATFDTIPQRNALDKLRGRGESSTVFAAMLARRFAAICELLEALE